MNVPDWMRIVSAFNPVSYMVHALRFSMIREVSINALLPDFAVMGFFAFLMFVIGAFIFERSID